jgi:folylpolyglutamate synthase/dihydropteroate synthase
MKSWEGAYPRSKVQSMPSVQSALELVKKIAAQENDTHVLITGSLHLVGETLRILTC